MAGGRTVAFFLVLWFFYPCLAFGDPVILAFGDSLTAGFGVPEKDSYPARIQEILKKNGFPHKVVNAGVSGDTTAGGLRRISWLMQHEPQIVILALGANDGLRGLPVSEMRSNLGKIIQRCREGNAKVLLVGMKMPPNYGKEYTEEFNAVYPLLAKKYDTPLIPFLLEGIAAKKEYTRPDGIHPLAEGYEIVAATVWKHLQLLLQKE